MYASQNSRSVIGGSSEVFVGNLVSLSAVLSNTWELPHRCTGVDNYSAKHSSTASVSPKVYQAAVCGERACNTRRHRNHRIQTERLHNIQDAWDTLLNCCSVFFSTCSSGYSSLNQWQRLSICDAPTFSTTYPAKQQTASGSGKRRMPLLKPVILFTYL